MTAVDLGFCESVSETWRLESPYFPSKIGGKPSWMSYKNLPTVEDLKCPLCQQPKTFLLQIYAPYEADDQNFHRTIFVFICRNGNCSQKNQADNVSVFRDSLPRNNEYYSCDPPDESKPVDFDCSKFGSKLCALCGCAGTKTCSKCKQVNYCCREHQVIHWKQEHKSNCCSENTSNVVSNSCTHLFPLHEIVIEPEEHADAATGEEVVAEEEMRKYEALKSSGKAGCLLDASDDELEQHAAVDDDKTFSKFRKVVAGNPEQILRYERGGEPLWIAKNPVPDDIPPCELCHGPRQFELQVIPQLLAILKEDAVDFGVLAVYTCKKSCQLKDGYKKEFIFKQDVTQ